MHKKPEVHRFLPVLLQSRDLQEGQTSAEPCGCSADLLMATLLPAERPEGKMALTPEGKWLFPWTLIKMVAPCHHFNLRS